MLAQMLPWVLPTLRVKEADNQQCPTSPATLRSECAAAIASFLGSVLTSCARRPHLPWTSLSHALSAQGFQSTPAPTREGTSTHAANQTAAVTALCTQAAHSGFVLLFSTLIAAMGRFRSQLYPKPAADDSHLWLHRSSSVEDAVWRFVADVAAAVLPTLSWCSSAASVLLGAVIDDIEESSDKLLHMLHTSWEQAVDCEGRSGSQGKHVHREICTVLMSHVVPEAFRALLQDLWCLSSNQGAHHSLLGGWGSAGSTSHGAASPRKRKGCHATPKSAVILRKGRRVAEFAVDRSLSGSSSLQHSVSAREHAPAAALYSCIMFGKTHAEKEFRRSHGSELAQFNSEVEGFGASRQCQALMAVHDFIRSRWHNSPPSDATAMATAGVRRVFAAVQELPSAHLEFVLPFLFRGIEEYCTGAAQQLEEAAKAPVAKSRKKAGLHSSVIQGTTAACSRHVAAAVAAVGVGAACCRPVVRQGPHGCNSSSLVSILSATATAEKHKPVDFAPCGRNSPDQAVHALCVAAVLLDAASAEGEPAVAAAAESQGATQRAEQALNVCEIVRVVAQTVEGVLTCPHHSHTENVVRQTSVESQLLIQDEQALYSPEHLQACCNDMLQAAEQAVAGVWTPAVVIVYKAHRALLEAQHWRVLAEALKELCSCAQMRNLESACDRDIAAIFLLGKTCMGRIDAAQYGSPELREVVHGHVETLYTVYDCACHVAFDNSGECSAPVMHCAMTFLSAFWCACGRGGAGGPFSAVMLAAWQPVARDSSLQLIDFALAGKIPADLVDAAAFTISCNSQAAVHAGLRMHAMLSSDASAPSTSVSSGALHALTVGDRSPLSCALLCAALMHEHTVPELFAAGKQVAAAIRPHVLRMLASATSNDMAHPIPGKGSESCPMWEGQAPLTVLAEACFRFHPLQARSHFAACSCASTVYFISACFFFLLTAHFIFSPGICCVMWFVCVLSSADIDRNR